MTTPVPSQELHTFADLIVGDRPHTSRIRCSCGWTSASYGPEGLDFDVHIAEVNGISFEEQKARTARVLRALRDGPRVVMPGRPN